MSNYELFYSKISDNFKKNKILLNIFIFLYKVIPFFIAFSYIYLLWLTISTTNEDPFIQALLVTKVILTPFTAFVVISIFRKIINAKRPYELYNIKPLINKNKSGESMPSRHILSITIIAMTWLYINLYVGIVMLILSVLLAVLRVIAGVHFPRDVIAGFCISVIWGIVGLWIL